MLKKVLDGYGIDHSQFTDRMRAVACNALLVLASEGFEYFALPPGTESYDGSGLRDRDGNLQGSRATGRPWRADAPAEVRVHEAVACARYKNKHKQKIIEAALLAVYPKLRVFKPTSKK